MAGTHVVTLSKQSEVTVEVLKPHDAWVRFRDRETREQYDFLLPEAVLDRLCLALADRAPTAVRDESGV